MNQTIHNAPTFFDALKARKAHLVSLLALLDVKRREETVVEKLSTGVLKTMINVLDSQLKNRLTNHLFVDIRTPKRLQTVKNGPYWARFFGRHIQKITYNNEILPASLQLDVHN